MLTDLEVARFLGHSDRQVRDHALRSLAGAGQKAEVSAEPAIAVLEKLGENAFSSPTQIAQLLQNDVTVQKAFEQVTGGKGVLRRCAAETLLELPQGLLAGQKERVAKLPAGELRSRLEARLAARRPEELWTELESASPLAGHDLVLTLASHDAFVADRVLEALSRPGKAELWAIDLAGRIHSGTALHLLVDRLGSPKPEVAKAAAAALGRLGPAGAVTVIEDRCNLASTTASFRLYAAKAFGCFRVPSVESALLRLLASEDDRAVTTAICQALVDTCTNLSVDGISEALKAGRCDATPELNTGLAALKVMLKEKPARPVESSATKSKPASGASAAFSPFSLGEQPIPPDDEPLQTPAAKPAPIRRSEAKAGRNDPCPCGSGKKYKKCCGK